MGIDGNKKVKGIKRHIAVDKNGFLLAVMVTVALYPYISVSTDIQNDADSFLPSQSPKTSEESLPVIDLPFGIVRAFVPPNP